jgi:hypothetical protein
MRRFFYFSRFCAAIVVCGTLIVSCSHRHEQIILTSQDGSHQLVYDAEAFIPQAKTWEDIQILRDTAWQITQTDPSDEVTASALNSAMIPIPDWAELERVVYSYKVTQLRRSK